ncbi:MAG: pirin family protein [Candidatus Obscuribacterales bacterium]|nr:pirin family protein [Candidatus Obscuribacterales bacterium]
MLTLREAGARGQTQTDWLDSKHTFSFADYRDNRHLHFGPLRVINEDFIAAKSGFPMHPHENMEILTYVVSGELEHKDSMGNGSTIKAGEIQMMSAGTGVLHSEWNKSAEQEVHLLQIWIFPERKGLLPSYQQKKLGQEHNVWIEVASANPAKGLKINQNAVIRACRLDAGQIIGAELDAGRKAWIQVVKGRISVNELQLSAGDGLSVTKSAGLVLTARSDSEFLLFDFAEY